MDKCNQLNRSHFGAVGDEQSPCQRPVYSGNTPTRQVRPVTSFRQVQEEITGRNPQQNASILQRKPVVGSQKCYSFTVNGVTRQYESLSSLLDEPQLMRKFQESYEHDSGQPCPDSLTLRHQLLTRQDMKNAFLLINNINEQVKHEPGGEATIYNPQMARLGERALSVTLHKVNRYADFMNTFPPGEVNALVIADAGLYFCLAEQKLVCHACGGSIKRWQSQWQRRSLKEVHAKLFPACSFLKKEFGQAFIDACRRSVADGDGIAPRTLADHPNLYALPPGQEQIKAEQDAREYRAELYRLSNPVDEQNPVSDDNYLVSSLELAVDESRRRLKNIPAIIPIMAILDQLSSCIKRELHARLPMTQDLLELYQDLSVMPTAIIGDIAGQIVEIARTEGRHSHRSQFIARVKSMMIFVHSQRKQMALASETSPRQQLIMLKTFFNETALFKVLYSTQVKKQPPVLPAWSYASRCWLRKRLCNLGCDFATNANDVQIKKAPAEIRAQLIKACQLGISNRADFTDFLVKTVTWERRFVPLLMDWNGTGSVGTPWSRNPRTLRDQLNLEHFLAELVRTQWDEIMRATTREQSGQQLNQ